MSAVDPTKTTLQAIIVTPTQLEKPDPNMECIQLLLYSDAGPTTGGVSVPMDLFGALLSYSQNIQALQQADNDMSDNFQSQLNDLDARITALETP